MPDRTSPAPKPPNSSRSRHSATRDVASARPLRAARAVRAGNSTKSALQQPIALLGGISPSEFMATYWQKKPLLIRQAAPEYVDRFPVDDLFELAESDDVESRLVRQHRGHWKMMRGPIDPEVRPTLGKKHWSLLVQGVNLHDDDAASLLGRFRFIPDARLDDLMVSYAVDGGGVGPHFDSYDVFLLQTHGRRRWRISQQRDLTLDPTQPMKILSHFEAEQEWILEPGDMLYLPPHVAHDGVALGECITCSIGFRAPGERELTAQFLHAMAERIEREDDQRERRYKDPDQEAVAHPAALPARLVDATQRLIDAVKWRPSDISSFLASYLTEPKATVFFDPPYRPIKRDVFVKRMMARGLRLDGRTQMLYDARQVFINGEPIDFDGTMMRKTLCRLADQRAIDTQQVVTLANDSPIVDLWYEWYLAGWIHSV